MTAKELKKLSRNDLLEMMLALSRENEQLREQLAQAQQQLKEREIVVADAGSLAEAALKLNGVFEATQAACEQYTQNIRNRCMQMEKDTKIYCAHLLEEAKNQAGMLSQDN